MKRAKTKFEYMTALKRDIDPVVDPRRQTVVVEQIRHSAKHDDENLWAHVSRVFWGIMDDYTGHITLKGGFEEVGGGVRAVRMYKNKLRHFRISI